MTITDPDATDRTPYGAWSSPLSADQVAAGTVFMDFPQLHGDAIYWTERRSLDEGQTSIVRRDSAGGLTDVTPAGFNAQTLMLEYGGASYTVAGDVVYAVRFADQRICALRDGVAEPITPDDRARYAELVVTPAGEHLLCVREVHRSGGVDHQVVAVPIAGGEPRLLVEGHEFFAAPRHRTRLRYRTGLSSPCVGNCDGLTVSPRR